MIIYTFNVYYKYLVGIILTNKHFIKTKMETLEKIKVLTEQLSVDTTKFYAGNKSAGTRARKSAQELKSLLQQLRGEVLESKKA